MSERVEIVVAVDDTKAGKSIKGVNKDLQDTQKGAKNVGSNFKGWDKILKASGILLLIGLIVKALSKVGEFMMRNATFAEGWDRAMKTVSTTMDLLSDILVEGIIKNWQRFTGHIREGTGFIERLRDRFDQLRELALDIWRSPMDYVKRLGQFIQDQVMNRIRALGRIAGAVWDILSGEVSVRDGIKEIGKNYADMVTGVENSVEKAREYGKRALDTVRDVASKTADKVRDGYNNLRKEVRSTVEESLALERAMQQLPILQANARLEAARLNGELNRQRSIVQDQNADMEDRIRAAERVREIEEQQARLQMSTLQEELRLLQAKNALSSSGVEDQAKELALQAQIEEARAASIQRDLRWSRQLSSLRDEELAREEERVGREAELRAFLREIDDENYERHLGRIEDEHERRLAELEWEAELREREIEEAYEHAIALGMSELEAQDLIDELRIQAEEDKQARLAELNENRLAEQLQNEMQNLDNIGSGTRRFNNTMNQFEDARLKEQLALHEGNEEKQDQLRRQSAKKQQNTAMTMALVEGALAAVKTLGNLGLPAAIPAVITTGIMTAANIATIRSQRLAAGGMVKGPGGPTDDKVPAYLSNGESVINARSTAMFRDELSRINQAGGGVKFAKGGIAGEAGSRDDASDLEDNVVNAIRRIPVTVSETEITDTQKRVSVAESDATF